MATTIKAVSVGTLAALALVTACRSEARPVTPTTPHRASVVKQSTPRASQPEPGPPDITNTAIVIPADSPLAAAMPPQALGAREAIATIAPTKGSYAVGSVRFREVDGGLEVIASVANLAGRHVYNVHVTGDCTASDASSAGDKLELTPAGDGDTITRDLGELRDAGGLTASHDTRLETVSLDALIGRSIVVILKSDNPYIPASKRTNERVGCGVIKLRQ